MLTPERLREISDAIAEDFLWAHTPHGYDWWFSARLDLLQNKNLSPERLREISDVIATDFIWSHTPHGYDWWYSVCFDLIPD
jgi:hypothetical protein